MDFQDVQDVLLARNGVQKAFRPSVFMVESELSNELDNAKKAENLKIYCQKAKNGERLFEDGIVVS